MASIKENANFIKNNIENQFCPYCGVKLGEDMRYCPSCGKKIGQDSESDDSSGINAEFQNSQPVRKMVYEGIQHKCPNCGEVLGSFVSVCPACGYEIRDAKASMSVREFAAKLEEIESNREYEKPHGLFKSMADMNRISKTDAQKISLIQNFPVPNTKEDLMEFMTLATSNINVDAFDTSGTPVTKSEQELNNAWLSKINQTYEKAKSSFRNDIEFQRIQELADSCITKINKYKKKSSRRIILMYVPFLVVILIIFLIIGIMELRSPGAARKETERLETIEQAVIEALDSGEYKKALLNAEILEYDPSIHAGDYEKIKEQWDIRRELLIDEILEEAEKNGILLEYTPPDKDTDEGEE